MVFSYCDFFGFVAFHKSFVVFAAMIQQKFCCFRCGGGEQRNQEIFCFGTFSLSVFCDGGSK